MNRLHSDLCLIAARWLQRSAKQVARCPVVFSELVSASYEKPDVIGFNSVRSVLIEVKTSRADFHADKKKSFRIYPSLGVGVLRYYLCPENILKSADMPDKWGLIWVSQKGRCKVVKEICASFEDLHKNSFYDRNTTNEYSLMYSALRRSDWSNVHLTEKYAK